MSDINKSIRELVNYGLHTGLVVPEDEVYTINRILEILKLDEYQEPENACPVPDLESTLGSIMDWAYEMVFWRKIPWDTVICLTQS